MPEPQAVTTAGQVAAESLMWTPCRIRRPIDTTTDPLTGESVPVYADPDIYSPTVPAGSPPVAGGCKIQQSAAQSNDVESGSSTAVLTPLRVDIPAAANVVRDGDFIEILDADGTPLRSFRANAKFDKTWQTAQRIPVTEVG